MAFKTEQQSLAEVHRVRDLLIKQRTMLSHRLHGQMAEFEVAAKGH